MLLNSCRSLLSESAKKRPYYLIYTLTFCCTGLFCFSWFILSRRSLIWQVDGWGQHYKALVYYSTYLREIIRHLWFDHKLVIPDWDFYIGEGSDIVNSLHYYVIGDPFALLSVLVPTKYMHYFYSFLSILRLYASGIAFSELCFGTGIKNRKAILAGALAYSLCYWGIYDAARHPYFINPMIFFPLMILGMEKVIRKERPYLFIVITAISAASNLYFFYMIVLLSVGYAVLRLFFIYRSNIHQGLLQLLSMGAAAILGVCISAVIILPVAAMFLNDSRRGVSQPFHLFYPLFYYSQLPAAFIEYRETYRLCLGISAPAMLCTFLLFVKKQKKPLLKALLVICCLITIFPICGRVLNGMSYMTNRWSWAFTLLLLYIMVLEWDALFELSQKEWRILLVISTIYSLLVFLLEESRSPNAFSVLPLFFVTLILVFRPKGKMQFRHAQDLVLLIIMVNVIIGAFWKFSPRGNNYAAECIPFRLVENGWADNESEVVKKYAVEDYPRYSGTLTQNVNMISRISNTGYYFSISNPSVSDYRSDLSMRETLFQQFTGYDDRTTPTTLATVDYYVRNAGDDSFLPFGYQYLGTDRGFQIEYDVYKNLYALPLGYCFDSYITNEIWATLDPVQRQEIQLEAALVDHDMDSVPSFCHNIPDYKVGYTIECTGSNITQTDSGFTSTENSTQLVLHFDNEIKASELYIGLEGIHFVPTSQYDLYFGDTSTDPLNLYGKAEWSLLSDEAKKTIWKKKLYWDPVKNATFKLESSTGAVKTIWYKQPDATHTSGRRDFIANLGFTEVPVTSVTITLPLRGIYSFGDICVYAVPFNGFEEKVNSLKREPLQSIELGVDSISGNITVADNRILCIATPYSQGWDVFVDGEAQELLCVNKHYLGVELSPGDHTVFFRYSTPYKHAGFIISVIAIIAFFILMIYTIVFLPRAAHIQKKEES